MLYRLLFGPSRRYVMLRLSLFLVNSFVKHLINLARPHTSFSHFLSRCSLGRSPDRLTFADSSNFLRRDLAESIVQSNIPLPDCRRHLTSRRYTTSRRRTEAGASESQCRAIRHGKAIAISLFSSVSYSVHVVCFAIVLFTALEKCTSIKRENEKSKMEFCSSF